MKAIDVSNLSKNYGQTVALDSINFSLETGEVLAFLGPNGAGKSTTMKIISCYLQPTNGSVKVDGIDVLENPVKVKEIIGYLPESTPLYENMIVYDFLIFAGEIHNIPKNTLIKRIDEIADMCGINEIISKKIFELSKGYRQRVGLAYAMIHDPKILILDEPTAGLDPNQIVEIRKLIKRLGEEKSVILSTHILSEAEATTNRAIIINNGRIVANGTVEEIRKENQHETKIQIKIKNNNIDAEKIIEGLKTIDGINDAEIIENNGEALKIILHSDIESNVFEDLYLFCKKNEYVILEMNELELTLEEIFKKLTIANQSN